MIKPHKTSNPHRAYNLHTLSKLKRVMELSLVKTSLAKFKTTCQKIYKRYRTTIDTKDGTYKVLQVTVERDLKKPLITYEWWRFFAVEQVGRN